MSNNRYVAKVFDNFTFIHGQLQFDRIFWVFNSAIAFNKSKKKKKDEKKIDRMNNIRFHVRASFLIRV